MVNHILFPFIAFISVLSIALPFTCRSAPVDSPGELTRAIFRQVPCLQENQYNYHKDVIRALSYTGMRALRVFCTLPDATADKAILALDKLVFYPLSFDQVQLLEFLSDLPGTTTADGWQLLETTADFNFTAMQAVKSIRGIKALTAEKVFELLAGIKSTNESGHWALKTFFSVNGMDTISALSGLHLIAQMDQEQARAAEQGCLIGDISPASALAVLGFIRTLSDADAANSRALFAEKETTADSALFWLQHYFSQSEADKKARYQLLSEQQKATLLASFSGASPVLIRKINDLHGVTDEYGAEIGSAALASSSRSRLEKLFSRLHPEVQTRFQVPFYQSLTSSNRYEAVDVLKQATALARKLTARDLSAANIYILLSHGSELYDSSFRDILVPVLLNRINGSFGGNLLAFLLETDPLNNHVSDFIVSCAQKGKLTAFFPENADEQRKILDLIAGSAFQNEQSLILFSATFASLLEKLQPDARTYLFVKMIETIRQPESTFALQLRVILQYYDDKHTDLLSKTDRKKIAEIIQRYGRVNLAPYTTTDFRRWKQDGRLQSLSIFQHDDDGKQSYLSNSRNLLSNGYKLRLSGTISLLPENSPVLQQAQRLIDEEQQQPGSSVSALYDLSVRHPVVFEWYKEVNGIELSHAVAVYQSESGQQQLLKQFLQNNMEMFAQRGHSYWREDQLLKPMRDLLETGQIPADTINGINRFMSIGSCGGIRVYSELNQLFNNTVDIFATVGTGKAVVNDPYNRQLFELVAFSDDTVSWEDITRKSKSIFAAGRGSDYLQPGSLPAILHKMMDTRKDN